MNEWISSKPFDSISIIDCKVSPIHPLSTEISSHLYIWFTRISKHKKSRKTLTTKKIKDAFILERHANVSRIFFSLFPYFFFFFLLFLVFFCCFLRQQSCKTLLVDWVAFMLLSFVLMYACMFCWNTLCMSFDSFDSSVHLLSCTPRTPS